MNSKITEIDITDDINGLKGILLGFRELIDGKSVVAKLNGKQVNLDDVLVDINNPELGFNTDVLPEYLRQISVYENEQKNISLFFNSQFDYAAIKKGWKDAGKDETNKYQISEVRGSLQILKTDGSILAEYGVSRVLIPLAHFDEFIKHAK